MKAIGFPLGMVAVAVAVSAFGAELDIDRLCPPRPETTAKFNPEAYPGPARSYGEAAKMIYRYMTGLPGMTALVETGKPNQKYQHNAYVSKTHAAHILAMLRWAKLEPEKREAAMKFARASAEFLLGELEPANAPLAYWPPTYGRKPLEFDPKTDGPYRKNAMIGNEPEGAVKYRGEVMLVYPSDVGTAFVAHYEATKDARFLTAAKGIAETYLNTRRSDGSWPLKMKLATGETVGENTLVPNHLLTFFEKLHAATGEAKWRTEADAVFAWIEEHPLKDWNWDGQFEDIKPEKPYKNPTKHNACDVMMYMLDRFPGDKDRLALCRRLLEFCEKRFVVWKTPADHSTWPVPSVLEQYSCFTPIDSSAAKMIRAYVAMYRAEGRPEDLAKARALADSITRIQLPSGRVPTFWDAGCGLTGERYDWLNCMAASADALLTVDAVTPKEAPCALRPVVRLKGVVGEKADRIFVARLTSPRERGDIFNEAVRAFRTKYDDKHPMPVGKGRTAYWQGEYWGKSMLSHCAYARMTGDHGEISFIRQKALELVREFQREDGYLATYDDEDYVKGSWNIWGRKYTMWALVEAYDLTGEKKLIEASVKMVRHLDSQLKRMGLRLAETGCFAGLPSMSILKPLLLVYERTGDAVALAMAKDIIAENDRKDGACPNLIANAFSDKPLFAWYSNPRSWAKAYEMMSVVEGFILYSEITGEERPFEAARQLFAKLDAEERNGVGSVGCHDHFYGARRFPNAISESCDIIHWMRLCKYLYARTGDLAYLDKWEVAFLNAFLAGVFRDGKWGAHDVRGHGRRHLQGLFEVGMYYHFCCLDNAPRGFCDWADGFVQARGKDFFDLNFYTDGEFGANGVRIAVSGNYPVNDRIAVRVKTDRPMSLGLRVPGWCGEMRVNDRPVTGPRAYVQVSPGDRTFDLRFAMAPRIETWTSDYETPDPGLARDAAKKDFEMPPHNPEMVGSARTVPGVRLLRGPLILSKCARAGGSDGEVLSDIGIDESWSVRLNPVANDDVWACWRATFEKGGVKKTVSVSDYQSAADTDDWRNVFSVWL